MEKQHILLRLHERNNPGSASPKHPALLVLVTFDTPVDATRFGNYVFGYQHKVFGNWNGATLGTGGSYLENEVLRLVVRPPHEFGCHTTVRLDPTYLLGEQHVELSNLLAPYWWADYLEDLEDYPGMIRPASLVPDAVAQQLLDVRNTFWRPDPLTQEFYEFKGLVIEPDSVRLLVAGRDTEQELDSDPIPNALLIQAQAEDLTPHDPMSVLAHLASIEEAFGPKPVTAPPPAQWEKPKLTREDMEKIFAEVTDEHSGELRKVSILMAASPVATPERPYEIAGIGFVSEAAWKDFDAAMIAHVQKERGDKAQESE